MAKPTKSPVVPKRSVMAGGHVLGHRAEVLTETDPPSGMRDTVLPLVLLVVGAVLRLVELSVLRPEKASWGLATACAVVGIGLAMLVLVAALVATGQFMGTELGDPMVLARKLLAIAVVGAVVGVFLGSLDKEPGGLRGLLLAVHGVLLVYFVLLAYLLRMDLLEALVATVIALMLHVGVLLVIGGVLPPEMARLVLYS